MPLLTASVPRYRKHRASGQAVVTLSGRDYYLGPHGTQVSHNEYDRRVAEWLARGRRPETPVEMVPRPTSILQLMVAYKQHAESYYVKHGQVTNEVKMVFAALTFVRRLYGDELVQEFGPLKLQAIQQAMIQADLSRGVINKQIGRIKRMFRWGVSQELVPPTIFHAIREVSGLAKGRSAARETGPILPISHTAVSATLPYLSATVADMVALQRLTAARPEEICLLRPIDLSIDGEVWIYQPATHKTEHQGRDRTIFIGPNAQKILQKYLSRDPHDYCFSPAEKTESYFQQRHQRRKTPLNCGNRPGSNRRVEPKRRPGGRYSTASYRRAIHRACEAAGVEKWSPHRLRHTAATEIRKQFGLEAAQVVLGHNSASITQLYAERNLELGQRVCKLVG